MTYFSLEFLLEEGAVFQKVPFGIDRFRKPILSMLIDLPSLPDGFDTTNSLVMLRPHYEGHPDFYRPPEGESDQTNPHLLDDFMAEMDGKAFADEKSLALKADLAAWIEHSLHLDPTIGVRDTALKFFSVRLVHKTVARFWEALLSDPYCQELVYEIWDQKNSAFRQGNLPSLSPRVFFRMHGGSFESSPESISQQNSIPTSNTSLGLPIGKKKSVETPDFEIKIFEEKSQSLPVGKPPDLESFQPINKPHKSNPIIILDKHIPDLLKAEKSFSGILKGDAFTSEDKQRTFVHIKSYLVNEKNGSQQSERLSFSPMEQAEQSPRSDEWFLGWYRYHPSESYGLILGSDKMDLVELKSYLTTHDSFFYRKFFNQPWHIGLIIQAKELTFLHWHRDELVRANGYYLAN